MRLVNEEGVDIKESDVDLMEGYVRAGRLLKEHHEAEPAVQEQGHDEYVRFYFEDGKVYEVEGDDDPHVGPDGFVPQEGEEWADVYGADQRWVVDVEGHEAKPAWDEYEDVRMYVLYTEDQKAELEARREAQAVSAAAVEFARIMCSKLEDDEAARCPDLFPAWSGDGVSYSVGDRVRYGGRLWRCLSTHASQATWKPTDAPSLWSAVLALDPQTAVEWVQPGSTNGYPYGQLVTWNGKTWRSMCDGNVWEPGALNTPWAEVA